jgi:hypothetical protein
VSITLPVETEQVGCVMVPTVGFDGVAGCGLITTLDEAAEVHPEEFVTVKVYVPDAKPVTVLLAPMPEIAPGLTVQVPEGKPFNTTLPVATVHVGCVMVPIVGAVGVGGCVLITTLAEATEVQPAALVTVKL